jgi:hypothetical protein
VNTYTAIPDLWDNDKLHQSHLASTCILAGSGFDCSTVTADFGLNVSARSEFSGGKPRNAFNSAMIDPNPVSFESNCWTKGVYDPSNPSTSKCFLCKNLRAMRNDNQFLYRFLDRDFVCQDSMTLSDHNNLENCQSAIVMTGHVWGIRCMICEPDHAMNVQANVGLNSDVWAKTCVPNAQCTSDSEGSYYEEQYNTPTVPIMKYCGSCVN